MNDDALPRLPHLRRPWDQLAGCMWLPRFVDKARLHLAGELPADFQKPFCHPLGTDGAFFNHFDLDREEIIGVVRDSAGDDDAVARWFTARPPGTPASIAAWNELAPRLGLPGTVMERSFRWALRHFYGNESADPRVRTVFTGLAWDEGCLDEIPAHCLP